MNISTVVEYLCTLYNVLAAIQRLLSAIIDAVDGGEDDCGNS